jgi:hypothetical protein
MALSTDEQRNAAFEAYAGALGKVAFSWNRLLETMSLIFVYISGMNRNTAMAVWHSTDSD